MACEVEAARFAIDAKDRDIVAALIAAVEELAGRVDVEAAQDNSLASTRRRRASRLPWSRWRNPDTVV